MSNATTIARVDRASLAGLALVVVSGSLAEAIYGPRNSAPVESIIAGLRFLSD
jgi:hypothetical protein